MNKEWFVFKGTHHLGPFTRAEMEASYRAGEIDDQSLIWREGQAEWQALSKTLEFKFLKKKAEGLPPLPPLPDLPELPELPDVPEEGMEAPPPIPLDAILNPTGEYSEVFSRAKKRLSLREQRIIFALLAVVFGGVLGWFAVNEKSSAVTLRIKGLMPVNLEKLQEVASQKTPFLAMTMALSHDGKTLFASTNRSGEFDVTVELHSVKNRILGTGPITLLAKGKMQDRVGTFNRVKLKEGARFVPGDYRIDFKGTKVHFLNETFTFLNALPFFKNLNSPFTYQTTTLIYAGTPREFEKKLGEYTSKVLNERLRPYTDKLERLQTFYSLVNKTIEDYLLILEKLRTPKGIAEFEKKFTQEVSPILQSLVVEAAELDKKGEKALDPGNEIVSYKDQVQFGKQLGEMASSMITSTQAEPRMGPVTRNALKKKFESEYKNLKVGLESSIKKLEEKIQGLAK